MGDVRWDQDGEACGGRGIKRVQMVYKTGLTDLLWEIMTQ